MFAFFAGWATVVFKLGRHRINMDVFYSTSSAGVNELDKLKYNEIFSGVASVVLRSFR